MAQLLNHPQLVVVVFDFLTPQVALPLRVAGSAMDNAVLTYAQDLYCEAVHDLHDAEAVCRHKERVCGIRWRGPSEPLMDYIVRAAFMRPFPGLHDWPKTEHKPLCQDKNSLPYFALHLVTSREGGVTDETRDATSLFSLDTNHLQQVLSLERGTAKKLLSLFRKLGSKADKLGFKSDTPLQAKRIVCCDTLPMHEIHLAALCLACPVLSTLELRGCTWVTHDRLVELFTRLIDHRWESIDLGGTGIDGLEVFTEVTGRTNGAKAPLVLALSLSHFFGGDYISTTDFASFMANVHHLSIESPIESWKTFQRVVETGTSLQSLSLSLKSELPRDLQPSSIKIAATMEHLRIAEDSGQWLLQAIGAGAAVTGTITSLLLTKKPAPGLLEALPNLTVLQCTIGNPEDVEHIGTMFGHQLVSFSLLLGKAFDIPSDLVTAVFYHLGKSFPSLLSLSIALTERVVLSDPLLQRTAELKGINFDHYMDARAAVHPVLQADWSDPSVAAMYCECLCSDSTEPVFQKQLQQLTLQIGRRGAAVESPLLEQIPRRFVSLAQLSTEHGVLWQPK